MPEVTIRGMKYNPEEVEVQVGGSVTWINKDSMTHTATRRDSPCAFDTGDIDSEPVTIEFKDCTPGTYAYLCVYHPRMRGRVKIVR